MKISHIQASDPLTRSKLADFAINPYVGCAFACRYCYACFTKPASHKDDKWGEFVDAKIFSKPINLAKIYNKSVVISPISDCYGPLERKLELTRNLLSQLAKTRCKIQIITKSSLVTRDIDILKRLQNVNVAISLNTLDEKFASDMDRASSVSARLEALKILHENDIKTSMYISPIFIGITDVFALIKTSKNFIDHYMFESLNLRYPYKDDILSYIKQNYTFLSPLYTQIYLKNDIRPLENLRQKIVKFCQQNDINFSDHMFHRIIKEQDKAKKEPNFRQPTLF
ncbi:radical SAM protein [Campylobacter sp. 9BO]|uniref:radical SAM protein n=1 Tax=Campylobacter sp. 9BO TaxID=3424759 RepID=UPI003D3568D9